MAGPLSIDLRERAVAAVLKGGLSRHRAAAQFGVVPSTVINWVRRFQETGSVAPGQMGGHKPKAIAGEHQAFLVQRIRDREFTLRGLVAELAERGLKVDYRSVCLHGGASPALSDCGTGSRIPDPHSDAHERDVARPMERDRYRRAAVDHSGRSHESWQAATRAAVACGGGILEKMRGCNRVISCSPV